MDALHISLPDVALLARVQRAPVSMWLQRYAGSCTPFPAPAAVRRGQSFFDGHQVVKWLETTGRGRNPDARSDLAAFAALAHADITDDTVFAGVTALLCLGRAVDPLPTDAVELLDLADDVDPDDEYLYREIDELGERAAPLARYAGLLTDAAFNAAAAFEKLMARRTRRPGSGLARTALAAPARHLVASLALALGTHAEIATPLFVDPSPGSSDLLVELAAQAGERGAVTVATPAATGPAGRLALRRIHVHDIVRETLPTDGQGGFHVADDAVLLMQLPAPDRPDMSDLEVLQSIEDVVLGSSDRRQAVVIGPASALVDRLPTARPDAARAAAVRDDLLRTDRVRGVVRLPAGLLPSMTRARLALWCLGPVPDRRLDGARTVVADLADSALDEAVTAELVTDLVAGMQNARAHAPRYARPVLTRVLRARTGDLVEPVAAAPRSIETAELAARITELTTALASPPTPPALSTPLPRSASPGSTTTIGAAVERGDLRVLSGLRLRAEHVDDDAGVRVIGPAELTGTSRRAVDRLVLAAQYPAAVFTEPGDVVFCTAPRPAALVEADGGATVTFPARVLRSRTARLLPRVLAADVNAQSATARTWRGWTVHAVPDDQVEALTGMLDGLAHHRAALAEQLDALDRLTAALTLGATTGTLDLT